MLVSEQCEIELQISNYKDAILCDVMPMDVCHILLGRPWQHGRSAKHDGRKNIYKLENDGVKHKLMPLQEKEESRSEDKSKTLLGGKEFLQQLNEEEVSYVIICKPEIVTKIYLLDFPIKIQDMLSEFGDIIVDDLRNELPPIRKISHHMDFIPGVSLPNKAAYRITSQENE